MQGNLETAFFDEFQCPLCCFFVLFKEFFMFFINSCMSKVNSVINVHRDFLVYPNRIQKDAQNAIAQELETFAKAATLLQIR